MRGCFSLTLGNHGRGLELRAWGGGTPSFSPPPSKVRTEALGGRDSPGDLGVLELPEACCASGVGGGVGEVPPQRQ